MQPPLVAVVILNWNGRRHLEQFLPSVMAASYGNQRVIVADNGSTDDSIAFLRERYPAIRIIELGRNYGFAGGYNRALKQVDAPYYILLNSDVEVTPGWIEPMVQLLESDQQIGACQPKLRAYHHPELFEYAGAAGGWLDRYGYPFARGRIFDICEVDRGQYDKTVPVFWASGAALFIRSAVFHSAGGFDEYFFAHQEEIDLCWRVQLAGHRVFACPASVVYHVGGGTLPRGNSRKTYLNFRNNRIMLSKNLSWQEKLWVMPFRYMLDAVSAWKGLLTGDGGYFVAIVRAHMSYVKWRLFKRHLSVFPKERGRPVEGRFKGNLVWLHFVKKKKIFAEIVKKEA
ncbi:glycosyltransferase family 2 protein [Terrimonas ferruginea]|uniref:glycosyltransferase family 2 protein n=1 Tax=Terrimonas ferruginea TaxID=249 RepID=UPI000403C2B2|nr:glycosyltransferase family 2 protein [Terrimonas ferruginea]